MEMHGFSNIDTVDGSEIKKTNHRLDVFSKLCKEWDKLPIAQLVFRGIW